MLSKYRSFSSSGDLCKCIGPSWCCLASFGQGKQSDVAHPYWPFVPWFWWRYVVQDVKVCFRGRLCSHTQNMQFIATEITPFTTVEILGRIFPDYFGLMAGVRNLVQSISGFLAFTLLPVWAEAFEDEEKGTTVALWMCSVLAFISLVSCVVVYISMNKEEVTLAANEGADQRTISKFFRAFALATTPKTPGCRRWMMPLAFWFAVFGIKAQYFAPFGFTAFSNNIYRDKFLQSRSQSSLLSGFISLVAGLMSPFIGELSDRMGKRAMCLAIGSSLSVVGFAILAVSEGGAAPVWIASTLFSLQYGIGDTIAYISIRFIVGIQRSGLGYGLYGVLGNAIATLVPLIGGFLMETPNGINKVLWYFSGIMALGVLCWVVVYFLEGPRSLLRLPADEVIETSDEDLKLAALSYVASPIKASWRSNKGWVEATKEEEKEDESIAIKEIAIVESTIEA